MAMTINDCMEEFKTYIESYCASATIEYYTLNLHLFGRYLFEVYGTLDLEINVLKKKDFAGYITYHRNRPVKNTSVRTYARAVKAFLKFCYNEGYLLEDITKNVKYPKSDNAIIVPVSDCDISLLENKILMTALPERNICIFRLMLDCGLRLSEVVNLNLPDVDFTNHFIIIRNSKNSKSRLVPLPGKLESAIYDYLEVSGRNVNDSGCLFLQNDGITRISKNAISIMFNRLKSVVPGIYPHLLRHTFATSFVLGGGSLKILRILMGHENYNVTKQYLHIAGLFKIMNYDIYRLDDIFFKSYNYNKRE